MTKEELRQLALECIEDNLTDPPGFRIVIQGSRYGTKCRIAKGLTGANLGHYTDSQGQPVTHVWLEAQKVIKYLESKSND